MNTINVLHIPGGMDPMRHVEVSSLAEMQALVGGLIQPMHLPGLPDGHELVVNEEGKMIGLEYNTQATDLARQFEGLWHPFQDYVAGPAFLVGPVNENGDMTSVDQTSPAYRFCQRMAVNIGDPIINLESV